jgi:hypothetical protein
MKSLLLLALLAALTLTGHADSLAPDKDATQAAILASQVGKTVELHLSSGEKIGGEVASVGEDLVHLTSLTGMEMFEATVTIDDIAAVVVRSAK